MACTTSEEHKSCRETNQQLLRRARRKVGKVKRYRYTPTYKFDVSMQAPGRSVGLYLPLEKISTALICSRERASLTVSFHSTHSDTEHSVPAHFHEWVCPESLRRLIQTYVRGRGRIFTGSNHASFKIKARSAAAAF